MNKCPIIQNFYRFLVKKYQIKKIKNRQNQSSDEGDIIDLKSTLFPKNIVTTG